MLTPIGRKIKQINILFGYLTILILIGGFIWFLVAKPKPVGKIESLKIENVQATLKTKEKTWQPPFTYKVTAEITNPNDKFNAQKVDYLFEIKNKEGKTIASKEGRVDVLAKEKKTVQEEITIESASQDLSFQLTKAQWEMASTD